MTNEYKIETIQDIFDVINVENIERFLTDFCIMFQTMAEAKDLSEKDGINMTDVKNPYFIWKDDGKTDISFKFNEEEGLEIKGK